MIIHNMKGGFVPSKKSSDKVATFHLLKRQKEKKTKPPSDHCLKSNSHKLIGNLRRKHQPSIL